MKSGLSNCVSDDCSKIQIGDARFLRQVAQAQQRLVFHHGSGAPVGIANGQPVFISTGDDLQMKVLGDQAGIIICRRAGAGIIGHGAGPVIHDVVEIDANAKAMRRLNHLNQLVLGAIQRGNRPLLVGTAQIKRVELVIADGKPAAVPLGRVGQPDAVVAGLGDLRHLLRHLGPGQLEQLQHRLAPDGGNRQLQQTRQ